MVRQDEIDSRVALALIVAANGGTLKAPVISWFDARARLPRLSIYDDPFTMSFVVQTDREVAKPETTPNWRFIFRGGQTKF
jgi:hypothetical protein